MTATDRTLFVPPLPVRVDPSEGESWRSYIGRVASSYGLTSGQLIGYFTTGSPVSPERPERLRYRGFGATPETITRVAAIFRLTAREVEQMHLQRFHGSAVTLEPPDRRLLDPCVGSATQRSFTLERIGFIRSTRGDRRCEECLRERPNILPLTWLLGWHVVCPRHALFLAAPGHEHQHAGEHDVAVQTKALTRLRPDGENALYFKQATKLLASSRVAMSRSLDVLAALEAAEFRGFPAHQSTIVSLSPRRHQQATLAPRSMDIATPWRALPRLVPSVLMDRTLSDLAPSKDGWDGRATIAVMCAMVARGCSMAEAAHGLAHGDNSHLKELSALEEVERRGQLEVLWAQVETLAARIRQQATDYQNRRAVADDPLCLKKLEAIAPDTASSTLRAWLREEWAADFTFEAGQRTRHARSKNADLFWLDRRLGATFRDALLPHEALASTRVVESTSDAYSGFSRRPLTTAQWAVLQWLAEGQPSPGTFVMRRSGFALEQRGLVTIQRVNRRWVDAQVTPDGEYFLRHGAYPPRATS